MATNSWVGPNGLQIFGTSGDPSGDWSLGHVPTSTDDAVINTNPSDAIVASSTNETVNSIALGSDDVLSIGSNSNFVSEAGTGSNVNNGAIAANSAYLWLAGGTFDNSSTGVIDLTGTSANTQAGLLIENTATVNLTGIGNIEMTIGGPVISNLIAGSSEIFKSSLNNETETISGTGTIGGDLNFTNGSSGIIETNINTSSSGGTLAIEGSAAGGSFVNNGEVVAQDGGTVVFGEDGQASTITNNATIQLDSTGHASTVAIVGNTTISSSSTGTIALGGSTPLGGDQITSDGHAATLTLINQTLKGAGNVGDTNLTLNVQSGSTVDANDGQLLELDTGNNTINNAGVLETANSNSLLLLASPVDNTATIDAVTGEVIAEAATLTNSGVLETASNGALSLAEPVNNIGTIDAVNGTIDLSGGVTGSGKIKIGAGGTLTVDSSVSGNVNFDASSGDLTLQLPNANGGISGLITGAVAGDTIDLQTFAFSKRDHVVWDQTSASGGTLSVYAMGVDLYTLALAGSYNSLDFRVGSDGIGGALITVQNTPSYLEFSGNNDEWILSDGQWAESAGPGSHPAGYNVAGIGDWTDSGTDGILWFNPTTGDTDEWQFSNTQWSISVDLGTHPTNGTDGASYQIAGTDGSTDFTGNGIDDVLWASVNTDGTIATDIWELGSNGKWANSVSPGPHPADYEILGTGDWTGNGTDGILWYNYITGDTDEWQLSNGAYAGHVDLGIHPANSTSGTGYQVAGIGDFFDNGRDDVLWTSVNSDGTVATDIWELNSSGKWTASVSPGNHPAGYSVVDVGDFTGTGTSDILWYNASTGDADEWLINNGAYAGHVDLGTHPGSFQIAGVGDFNGDGTKDILWHSPS